MAPSTPDDARTRRRFWLSAAVLGGVIVAMTLVFALNADLFKPAGDTGRSDELERPRAIERPYSGQEPTHPGDRGGWEQLVLLGVIVVAIGGGTAAVVVSSRRARAGRGREAAHSAQDPAPVPTDDRS